MRLFELDTHVKLELKECETCRNCGSKCCSCLRLWDLLSRWRRKRRPVCRHLPKPTFNILIYKHYNAEIWYIFIWLHHRKYRIRIINSDSDRQIKSLMVKCLNFHREYETHTRENRRGMRGRSASPVRLKTYFFAKPFHFYKIYVNTSGFLFFWIQAWDPNGKHTYISW